VLNFQKSDNTTKTTSALANPSDNPNTSFSQQQHIIRCSIFTYPYCYCY